MSTKYFQRATFWLCAALLGFAFCGSEAAYGQMNFYNFGQSPALSPWLSLGNRPTGVLDSYSQYVRPQLEIQQAFAQQQAQLNRQAYQQQSLQGDLETINAPQKRGSYSRAASFRNYSHYYPNMKR